VASSPGTLREAAAAPSDLQTKAGYKTGTRKILLVIPADFLVSYRARPLLPQLEASTLSWNG
jgi:hypothetical protein